MIRLLNREEWLKGLTDLFRDREKIPLNIKTKIKETYRRCKETFYSLFFNSNIIRRKS